MTIPSIDLTAADPFELIQLKAQIATEQARRDQLTQARAQLNAAMAGFLCAGGCKDALIAEIQATPDPTPTLDPPADPEPDPEPTEGDDSGDGEAAAPPEGDTPPGDDPDGTPTA